MSRCKVAVLGGYYTKWLLSELSRGAEVLVVQPPRLRGMRVEGARVLNLKDDKAVTLLRALKEVGCGRVVSMCDHDNEAFDHSQVREALGSGSEFVHHPIFTTVVCGDKVLSKTLFDMIGVPTPPWSCTGRTSFGTRGVIEKTRLGWGGRGIHALAKHGSLPSRPPEGTYWEAFIPGREITAVVLAAGDRWQLWPLVDKGQADGHTHPLERIRIAPAELPDATHRLIIQSIDRAVAALKPFGMIDFDFVIDDMGVPLLLEINSRISGASLLSMASTSRSIFAELLRIGGREWDPGEVEPIYVAMEVPVPKVFMEDEICRRGYWHFQRRESPHAIGRVIVRHMCRDQVLEEVRDLLPFV